MDHVSIFIKFCNTVRSRITWKFHLHTFTCVVKHFGMCYSLHGLKKMSGYTTVM